MSSQINYLTVTGLVFRLVRGKHLSVLFPSPMLQSGVLFRTVSYLPIACLLSELSGSGAEEAPRSES